MPSEVCGHSGLHLAERSDVQTPGQCLGEMGEGGLALRLWPLERNILDEFSTSNAAASLCFNCSWLSEISVSLGGLFWHCFAQEGRGGGCTRRLGSKQHFCSHPHKNQALGAPTTFPRSRALLQKWTRFLGRWQGKRHMGGLREATVC